MPVPIAATSCAESAAPLPVLVVNDARPAGTQPTGYEATASVGHSDTVDVAQLVEFLPDGMVGVDAWGLISHVNPRAAAMVGHAAADLIGTSHEDLFGPPEVTTGPLLPLLSQVEDALRSGTALRQVSARCIRADGSAFPVEVSIGPIFSGERLLGLC